MSNVKLLKFWAVTFLLAVLCLGSACAATFTASLDRDSIALGETARLTLKFEGGQPTKLDFPKVDGLQFGTPDRSFSQNIDFNSGQANSKFTFSYSIIPQREGEFLIPALVAEVDGKKLSSEQLKLVVTKAAAPSAGAVNSGSQVAFMKLALPNGKIYVGQVLTAQLEIYLRDDVQDNSQPEFTATPAEGFMLGKSGGGTISQIKLGNHAFTVCPITIAMTATKTGTLTLGPFSANMVVALLSSEDQQDPLFRQQQQMMRQMGIRLPQFGGEQKRVSLVSEQATVESLPLPTNNIPADFNGAIGDYSMNVSAGPTNIAVGDPITLHIQISGRGSPDDLKLPEQSTWNDFKLFPPTSKTEFSDQFQLEGSKTFEEIVTPQSTDVHELPAISFSFFNPEDGKYHTLTQPAIPITVKAAGATQLPQIAANKSANAEKSAPDISPIKNDLGTLTKNSAPLIAQSVFLAVQSLPVLAFLGAFIWRKKTDSLANNPRLRRQRAVAALIASGMDDLKKYATANQSDEFFATLFRLLQEQLGERLDCPASAITENVVHENSVLRGAPEILRNDLGELFQLCNQARYAPVRGTSELNSVAAQFEKTIVELQSLKT